MNSFKFVNKTLNDFVEYVSPDVDNYSICEFEEGTFNIDYLKIRPNCILIRLSSGKDFYIYYNDNEIHDVKLTDLPNNGLKISLNKKEIEIRNATEYVKIVKSVINEAKKYDILDPKAETVELLKELGLNFEYSLEINKFFVEYFEIVQKAIKNPKSYTNVYLKAYLSELFLEPNYDNVCSYWVMEKIINIFDESIDYDENEPEIVSIKFIGTIKESDDTSVAVYVKFVNNEEGIFVFCEDFEIFDLKDIKLIQINDGKGKIVLENKTLYIDLCGNENLENIKQELENNGVLKSNYKPNEYEFENLNIYQDNIEIFDLLKDNDLLIGSKFYDIIYSNTGEITDFEDFAGQSIKNVFDKGIWGGIKGFVGSVANKVISDKKVMLLSDNGVIYLNLDKSEWRIFDIDDASNFVYRKDEYLPDAVDIFESMHSNLDDPLIHNVLNSEWNRFYLTLKDLAKKSKQTQQLMPSSNIRTRLKELKELFDDGLLDENEYKTKRESVLNQI